MTEHELEEVCGWLGVAAGYHDAWGEFRATPTGTRIALLDAMGFDTGPGSGRDAAILRIQARRWRTLPPVRVIPVTEVSMGIPVVMDAGSGSETWTWILTEEGGISHRGSFRPADAELIETGDLDGRRRERRRLGFGLRLPLGYHQFGLFGPGESRGPGFTARLIVVPGGCHLPEDLRHGERAWGYAVQLYSLRSSTNWGIGDFRDLGELLERSGAQGARLVGVNPLHALFVTSPGRASPYAPSSRLFLNPVYLDPESIPDFEESGFARESTRSRQFQARLEQLRGTTLVDHAGVVALKLPVLEILYRSFRSRHLVRGRETARGKAFRDFQREGGEALRQYGVYEALIETLPIRPETTPPWRNWPPAYRRPDSPESLAFAREHGERIEFHQYLQWQADLQLEAASRAAAPGAEGIGLFRDLAVGASADGSESWADPSAFLDGMEVGAPPDAWNLKGQKWGFPPPNPWSLEDAAYAPFRDLLRANMRHAQAIRIDHVMGLARLFCVPVGASAVEGAYLPYRFEDLLGILALESRRHRCLVVGEDLGTVPPGMRERLHAAGVLSCRLLYFERDPAGGYTRPEHFPRQAMVALTTHDLPTAAGFWTGHDLEIKRALDLFRSPEEEQDAPRIREQDRQRLREALSAEGLGLEPGVEDGSWTRMVLQVHRYLARTPSMLFMANLTDLVGQEDQINVPGTPDAEPNWRLKLPLAIEEIFRDPLVVDIAREIDRRRTPERLG